MVAAVIERLLYLFRAPGGADDRGTKRPRPLRRNQPRTPSRCVPQDSFTLLHWPGLEK
ncbi:hypothetical protein D3C87_2011840 [compost metagenome]